MGQQSVRQSYEAILVAVAEADDAVLDRLIAVDLIDHNPVAGQAPGRAGFKDWAAAMREVFAELTVVVEDTVVEGDKVGGRVTWRGRHQGAFVGVPATGVPVEIQAVHIVRFVDGRAAEWWGTADIFGALMQMGARITPPT